MEDARVPVGLADAEGAQTRIVDREQIARRCTGGIEDRRIGASLICLEVCLEDGDEQQA
jgi:hypothetical protein